MIKLLTEADKEQLLSKTAYVLPDNPSNKNFSASQIKRKMYEGYLVLFDYINNLIADVNTDINDILIKLPEGESGGSQTIIVTDDGAGAVVMGVTGKAITVTDDGNGNVVIN